MAFKSLRSFCPAGGDASGRPTSILLTPFSRVVGGQMDSVTTATARSSDGHTLEISLWTHHPPALSYFCARCHAAPGSELEGSSGFHHPPQVVGAADDGRFFLLRTSFVSDPDDDNDIEDEYFMYKQAAAGSSGESSAAASLDPVPIPTNYRLPNLKEFGVAPRGHGGHYLVAGLELGFNRLWYWLHVYSSEDERWTTIKLPNPCPEICKVITGKVVTIGEEGLIAWVDFERGMLMVNVNERTNPSARYFPLPDPLPKNFDDIVNDDRPWGPSARLFRDLTCIDGVLKLVEVEHRIRVVTETPPVPKEKDKLYDSDLIVVSRKRKHRSEKREQVKVWDGWKAVTWSRTLSSSCCYWEVGQVFDASEITLDGSMRSSLLRGFKGETPVAADKMSFKDLYSAYPTLSAEGDDVLYLSSSMTKFDDLDGWVVAVDLTTKRVKAIADDDLDGYGWLLSTLRPRE